MCGLVAVLSKNKFGLNYKDTTIFKQMLFADVLRGADATGIFGVNKYGNLKMVKAAVPSTVFINREKTKELLDDKHNNLIAMVGHNRAATKGASDKDEFAHPFIEGNICLVHNGTLTSHVELAKTEVDSHAICHAINEDGYEKTLSRINGAFALIWYEADTKNIRFTRNSQRPLWMVETKSTIFLASELEMVQWIASRNNEVIIEIEEIDTNKVYSYNVDTQLVTTTKFPVKKNNQMVLQYQKQTYHQNNKQLGGTGGASVNLLWSAKYSTGDKIKFEILTVSPESTGWLVEGKVSDTEKVSVRINDEQANHILDLLSTCCVMGEATVSVVYYTSKNNKGTYKYISNDLEVTETVLLSDLFVENKEDVKWLSENNVWVSQKDLEAQGGCCTQCGGFIDTDTAEDIMFAHVKYKRGKIKTLICSDCLDTFRESIPNYGKGRKYASKTRNHHSVQAGEYLSKDTEELTAIESIRTSISC